MLYTLKNDNLVATIDDLGAQIVSVKRADLEYIWYGNANFWAGHAPILFPICGRLFEGKYTFEGKEYEMNLHGFARKTVFDVESASESEIVLSLSANENTLAQYPFNFKLTVSYTLTESKIESKVVISNLSDKIMPATFGAHPGFNVPLDTGSFDDWYIEFPEECTPNRLIISEAGLLDGKKYALSLADGKKIALSHGLFDNDGIFMDKICHSVTLASALSERSVTLNFPDMSYLGIWHPSRTEAPFVCIEPWCGLPALDGQMDDLLTKHDMFHIYPNAQKQIAYEIIFN